MRINLPRYSCVRFTFASEVVVTLEQDTELQSFIDQASTHTHGPIQVGDEEITSTVFGSRSVMQGIVHLVQAGLTRTKSGNDITASFRVSISKAEESISRPPKDIRPVSVLVSNLPRLFGPINSDVDAVFEYTKAAGYSSLIPFPIPLVVPTKEVTHFEGAQFSRRIGDDVEYYIAVIPSEEGDSFTHLVEFKSTVELNHAGIRDLFQRSRHISAQMLG